MNKQNPQRKFSPDFGVAICDHIYKNASSVLLVVRDEEKSWQFLCGGPLENDPCHHVDVGHLIASDSSLEIMSNLPIGHYAERETASSPWVYGALDE